MLELCRCPRGQTAGRGQSDRWLEDLLTDHLLVYPIPLHPSFHPLSVYGVFSYPEGRHRLRRQEEKAR